MFQAWISCWIAVVCDGITQGTSILLVGVPRILYVTKLHTVLNAMESNPLQLAISVNAVNDSLAQRLYNF